MVSVPSRTFHFLSVCHVATVSLPAGLPRGTMMKVTLVALLPSLLPLAEATERVVGLNTWPGDIGLGHKNRGCSSACTMHQHDKAISRGRHDKSTSKEKLAAMTAQALEESDFYVVDGWRGLAEPNYRYVGVQELWGGDRGGKMVQAPRDKLTVSSNMDPYVHAPLAPPRRCPLPA